MLDIAASMARIAGEIQRGNSSVGRAQPCQGWGREFESRFPLQNFLELEVITGWVAEWLCSGLQSRGRRFDSDLSLIVLYISPDHARVAELVDARDLKSLGI